MRKNMRRMGKIECNVLSILLLAMCMAKSVGIVRADTISINYQRETSVGSYIYPLNSLGNFAPAYLYIPAENDEQITILAQDGATLHIFDDAAGTNALPVPASLATDGQAQQLADGSCFNTGIVHLTQGWHKLYVTHTVLTLNTDDTGNYCRVNYATGVLHNQIETVTTTVSIGDWQGAGPWTSAITLQMVGSDGVTPAAGDSVTIAVAKVTSDPQGQNVLNAPCLSWDYPIQRLDANGSMTANLTWGNNCDPCIFKYYIWLTVTDNSQPPPYTPVSNVQPARSQSALMAAQTSGYTYALPAMPAPCFGGGGGGGATPYPVRCIKISKTPQAFNGPRVWGHIDVWHLQIIDQNGTGIRCSSTREAFSNINRATSPQNLANELRSAPGTASTWGSTDATGHFDDTNGTILNFNPGGGVNTF